MAKYIILKPGSEEAFDAIMGLLKMVRESTTVDASITIRDPEKEAAVKPRYWVTYTYINNKDNSRVYDWGHTVRTGTMGPEPSTWEHMIKKEIEADYVCIVSWMEMSP